MVQKLHINFVKQLHPWYSYNKHYNQNKVVLTFFFFFFCGGCTWKGFFKQMQHYRMNKYYTFSHHHLCCWTQRGRKSGGHRNPQPWGNAWEGARPTSTPPNPPSPATDLTDSASCCWACSTKNISKTPLCNVCLCWGVCPHSAKEIRWFQGNPWHRELPGDARWQHPSPAPRRAQQHPQGNDLLPNLLLLCSRHVCFKPQTFSRLKCRRKKL